jgi:hypothetical protein
MNMKHIRTCTLILSFLAYFTATANGAILFKDDYESGWAGTQNGWSYGAKGSAESNSSVVISSDRSQSGKNAVKYTYAKDEAWAYVFMRNSGSNAKTTFHRRFYVFFEPGFYYKSGGHLKFGKVQGDDSDPAKQYGETWNVWPASATDQSKGYFGQLQFTTRATQWAGRNVWYNSIPQAVSQGYFDYKLKAGQWYCVETRSRINTGGSSNPNGEHALWIDGKLQWKVSGVQNDKDLPNKDIKIVEIFSGWFQNGSPRTQSIWFDNMVVADEYIGCAQATDTTAPSSAPSSPGNLKIKSASH